MERLELRGETLESLNTAKIVPHGEPFRCLYMAMSSSLWGTPMAKRFRNILGPNVRALRQQAGLTQDDLAARLQLAGLDNIDRVAVAKIESQIRSLYDFEVLVLARVLKVPPEQLLSVAHAQLRTALPALIKGEKR